MRRRTEIKQHDKTDCAAACIASVCAHYGLRLPMITIRDACGTREDGTTMQGIIDAFSKVGLDAAGFKAKEKNAECLKGAAKPLILHLKKLNGWLHFVVLYTTGDKYATIMDPAEGRLHRIGYGQLTEEWSGYVISASPSAGFRKGDFRIRTGQRLMELIAHSGKELFPVLAGTLASICMTIGTSLFLQRIIDDILPARNTGTLAICTAALVALAIMGFANSYLRGILLTRVSLMIDCRLITGYFRKIFSLPVSFFDSRSIGELNARVSDAYRIRSFITGRLLLMAISTLTIAVSLTVMFTFNFRLAAITAAFIPAFVIIYRISGKVCRKWNRKIIEANTAFEETSIETLECARTYMYCNAAERAEDNVERKYISLAGSIFRGSSANVLTSAASECLGRLMYAITLGSGAYFILNGQLSLGELVSFLTMTSLLTSPVLLLIESNDEISEAHISAERIFDIIDMEQEETKELQHTGRFSGQETLSLRNVSFSFPGRRKLIENFSCEFLPGSINLVKGPNGSGKSTLATLLMKGYSPSEGGIYIDGIDIKHIPTAKWRQNIAIVPQRPDIFKGSILDNVVMGATDYDIRDALASCAAAGMGKMLERMPDGVLAATDSLSLSGGERQKIAIARALFRRASIIIFDEADTYLDTEGKVFLENTIRSLKEQGMTIIIITHEEKTINADRTICM